MLPDTLCIGMRREEDGRHECPKKSTCRRYQKLFQVKMSEHDVRTMLCFKDGKPDLTFPYFL